MSARRAARLVLILIASSGLIGCGSGTGTPASSGPPVPALLNGNWNLAGNRALLQFPLLSLSLIVNGSQITANGDEGVQCSNRLGGVGGSFSLTGQLASDGTFVLAESPVDANNSIQVAVTGTAPTAGSNTWAGTYSFTDLAGYTSCLVNQSGPLVAAPLSPFTGTYAGILTSSSGNDAVISLAVTQGGPTTTPSGSYYLPVTVNATVSGSLCFTSGTTSTSSISKIQGDQASLSLTMTDGSLVLINATFADPSESTLAPAGFFIFGGQCNGRAYLGTLVRQ